MATDVCVVGGGPGGLTLALELARRGREVIVVEKAAGFDRTFRGESISPDSVWLLHRLGVLEALRSQDITEVTELEVTDDARTVLRVRFEEFDRQMPFPVEVPQPMLLGALAEAAQRHAGFTLLRQVRAVDLVRAPDSRVVGIRCRAGDRDLEIRCRLTVGADGRYSRVRDWAGIQHRKAPLERDFLWFVVPYPSGWKRGVYRVRLKRDHHAMLIPTHPDLLRVGFNIPKNGLKELRARPIGALHERIDELVPEIAASVREHVTTWSDTSMLEIFTTAVPRWGVPGLILIGDAAHTMSPVLGQGVNHAIMDAVALAPMVDDALGQPDAEPALDEVAGRLQQLRHGPIRQARAVQLRQEKVFTLSSPPATLLRRGVYRMIDRIPALKRRIWSRVYYTLPQAANGVRETVSDRTSNDL